MNSVANFAALLAFLVAASQLEHNEAIAQNNADKLIVEGRIVLMQGSCNALRCPSIQYEVTATKIRRKPFTQRTLPDAHFSVLNACGTSGLILGGHYLFTLDKNVRSATSLFDRPVGASGEYLECHYSFEDGDVAPVALSPRFLN